MKRMILVALTVILSLTATALSKPEPVTFKYEDGISLVVNIQGERDFLVAAYKNDVFLFNLELSPDGAVITTDVSYRSSLQDCINQQWLNCLRTNFCYCAWDDMNYSACNFAIVANCIKKLGNGVLIGHGAGSI